MSKYMKLEKTPAKKYNIIKKVGNMKKETNVTPAKQYTKSRSEHVKDILIVALVIAIASFIGGMQFQRAQSAEIQQAVKSAQLATPVKK